MIYTSTRDAAHRAGLDEALARGLAPDGGLYVPQTLPALDPAAIEADADLPMVAAAVLAPFFAGSSLADSLPALCRATLDLPVPLTRLDDELWMLELHHGPSAAFKDFAARFLAGCMQALAVDEPGRRTVLVATSGDTGAAVGAAFHRRPGFRVVILYPDGRVAQRQAHQLGAFGDNVHAFRVRGDFDDCQRMVKQALGDPELAARHRLTSANSISIGRLLPQIAYYALAALRLAGPDRLDVIVPTGNLGNALACVLARECGFPIGTVFLATNANRTLPDYFAGQDYRGRAGLRTLANAMDVGDPSNFERLAWLFKDPRRAGLAAEHFDDAEIAANIRHAWATWRQAMCPHTACALGYARRLTGRGRRGRLLIVATAHAAKFDTVVEPLIGEPVAPPEPLAELLSRPSRAEPLEPGARALADLLGRLGGGPE